MSLKSLYSACKMSATCQKAAFKWFVHTVRKREGEEGEQPSQHQLPASPNNPANKPTFSPIANPIEWAFNLFLMIRRYILKIVRDAFMTYLVSIEKE